jgi:hypothetical protein
MATFLKDPPSFVTNIGAWEYVLAKLAMLDEEKPKPGKPRLDEGGNPTNYGQAVAIYKAVCKKYAAFQNETAIGGREIKSAKRTTDNTDTGKLCTEYPVGELFWYDDVLCEAVEYAGGEAVYPDPEGNLFIRGKIVDVDPEGHHRNWPVGKINGFPPHRCANWTEA